LADLQSTFTHLLVVCDKTHIGWALVFTDKFALNPIFQVYFPQSSGADSLVSISTMK